MDRPPGEELASIDGLPPDLVDLPPACPFTERCPFVKDVCHEYNPPLFELEPGHYAACWVDMETDTVREDLLEEHLGQAEMVAGA
jgi:ABC-type dipeptide/oligopeptide/nickel transport system ATPase component